MGEESRQLKEHIDNTRDELARNIDELRDKVRRAVDWRAQFQERPLAMIGLAFGAGLLLAVATRSVAAAAFSLEARRAYVPEWTRR